jgi:hypothetical protein
MGETGRTSSLLVHILVIALCLTAFGFAIAAERRRSTVLLSSLFAYTRRFIPCKCPPPEPRVSGSDGFRGFGCRFVVSEALICDFVYFNPGFCLGEILAVCSSVSHKLG